LITHCGNGSGVFGANGQDHAILTASSLQRASCHCKNFN
jgi:hypothetical protein